MQPILEIIQKAVLKQPKMINLQFRCIYFRISFTGTLNVFYNGHIFFSFSDLFSSNVLVSLCCVLCQKYVRALQNARDGLSTLFSNDSFLLCWPFELPRIPFHHSPQLPKITMKERGNKSDEARDSARRERQTGEGARGRAVTQGARRRRGGRSFPLSSRSVFPWFLSVLLFLSFNLLAD